MKTGLDTVAENALREVIHFYDKKINQNSFIYNGRIYRNQYDEIGGHPYFSDDSWEPNKMIYQGEPFDSIPVMYDIYNDQVLLKNFNEKGRLAPIIMDNDNISVFYLHDHRFIYLEDDTLLHLQPGIYDLLYSGRSLNLISKRKKEIILTTRWNDLREDFVENDSYFLNKERGYYRIKNMRSLLKVLKVRKKELKAYIRTNNLNYSENFEEAMIKIVAYFETF